MGRHPNASHCEAGETRSELGCRPALSVTEPSDPRWGDCRASSRGLMMGNRGCIHGPDRLLRVARWRSKLWICCVLSWRDVRRDVMPPGRWTALFFLDEATALAAGHRPCGYCRREDHPPSPKHGAWATRSTCARSPLSSMCYCTPSALRPAPAANGPRSVTLGSLPTEQWSSMRASRRWCWAKHSWRGHLKDTGRRARLPRIPPLTC